MKRDRFRLATVLRVRQLQEDAERGRLALARAGALRATSHSAAQTDRYREGSAGAVLPGSTDAFIGTRGHVDRLANAVVSANGDLAAAEVVVDERRLDWSVAAQRVAALDRLRDRHRQAFVASLLSEDVLDADERTVSRRHRARSPEPVPLSRELHRPTDPPPVAPAEFQ